MRKAWAGSILFHVLAGLLIWNSARFAPTLEVENLGDKKNDHNFSLRTLSQKQYVEELRKALDGSEKQIVHSEERLRSDQASSQRFVSKTNQHVDAETRAARSGKFKNVLKEGITTPDEKVAKLFKLSEPASKTERAPTDTTPPRKEARLFRAANTDSKAARSPASLGPTPQGPRGEGLSSTDDYLDDIAIGANTLLNAQEFKYYGFYERIRERITSRWQDRLQREFDKLSQSHPGLQGEMITKLRVILNERGEIERLMYLGKSGIDEFDTAAREAFYAAQPFPNPPQGMINEQKLVSIRWDFVVLAEESGVQVRVQRGGF